MDLLLPLVSLLLIAGGGGHHVSFADAATKNSATPRAYWEAVLPGTPMPPAVSDLLAQREVRALPDVVNLKLVKGLRKIGPYYKKIKPEADQGAGHSHIASQAGHDLKEVSASYGSKCGDNLKEVSMSYGIEGKDVSKGGSIAQEGILKEVSVSYGSDEGKDEHIEVLNQGEEDPHRVTMLYGEEQEDDPNKATMTYGSEQEEDPHKATMSYGANHEDDPNKATMTYGLEQEDDPHKLTMSYRANQQVDPNKVTLSYGSEHEECVNKITFSYVSEQKDDPNKATMSYGSEDEVDPNKATMSYKLKHGNDLKTVSTGHKIHIEGETSHHVPSHSHKNKRQADVFFFRDMLRPGSMIIPTIPPTTTLPALLPRHIADSLPFSTKRLSDIIAMFVPTSLGMTRDIRWTLDTCEHPRTLPGEKAGCATSLESLGELTTSLLGTSNIRAFSAANLPVEAPGTLALRGKYNVTLARRLSESSEIVTCHDLTYPYAVYYCHTSNPTAAYAVTLESVEGGTTPTTMEALAVCHLDTMQWSPKHPFFALHNVKPGDVAVCHFLTKLSIVWVRAGEPGGAHVAGR